jgi:hypothetical protein
MFQPKTLDYWAKKEVALLHRKSEIKNVIAVAESTAAVAMLDDDEPAGASATIATFDRARAEIRALEGAVAGCRTRRLDAIRAQRADEAAKYRREAADKMKEARSIDTRVQKLLTQVIELEGCAFQASSTPNSSRLRAEAEALEREAQDMDARGVPDWGMIDIEAATTADEVVTAALLYPADGPSAEQVQKWLADCEASAVKRCASGFGHHSRRVRVEWDSNGIKPASYIFVRALAKRLVREFDDPANPLYDIPSATFHGETA